MGCTGLAPHPQGHQELADTQRHPSTALQEGLMPNSMSHGVSTLHPYNTRQHRKVTGAEAFWVHTALGCGGRCGASLEWGSACGPWTCCGAGSRRVALLQACSRQQGHPGTESGGACSRPERCRGWGPLQQSSPACSLIGVRVAKSQWLRMHTGPALHGRGSRHLMMDM